MKNELISVIVPTHNRDNLLGRALGSIKNQTYKNFEVLVVDDIGNESTKELVDSFADGRFQYIHNEEHQGATYSRNLGIKKSRGNYIVFLDDDDEWYEKKLELQLEKFYSDKEIGLVYGKLKIEISSLNIDYITAPSIKGNIYKDLIIENYVGGTIIPMINLNLVSKEECYFDTKFPAREEYDLWIRLSRKHKVDFVDDVLAVAYNDFDEKRISSDIKNYEEGISLLNNKYQKEVEKLLTESEQLNRKILQLRFLAAQAIKVNNTKIAREKYLEVLKLKFSLKNLVFYLMSFLSAKNIFLLRKYLKG
ncbi:putative Glycosyltransferase [Tenacibaculum litoreum]